MQFIQLHFLQFILDHVSKETAVHVSYSYFFQSTTAPKNPIPSLRRRDPLMNKRPKAPKKIQPPRVPGIWSLNTIWTVEILPNCFLWLGSSPNQAPPLDPIGPRSVLRSLIIKIKYFIFSDSDMERCEFVTRHFGFIINVAAHIT